MRALPADRVPVTAPVLHGAARAHSAAAHCPVVSFIIPVRNDADRLRSCLRTIAASDYPRHAIELIVVDNGSTDRSAETARRAGAIVLSCPGRSVAELRNHGARRALGSVLAFVDADHEIDPGWLPAAVDVLGDPRVAAVGALCHTPPDPTWTQRVYDSLRARADGQRDVEWLGSGNLVVCRGAFERAGGFDQDLVTCEDVDLCRRLRAAGHRIVSDDRLRSVHFGDPATLGALFRGELWRGRDNLRVSLRPPVSWRSLPSILIPVLDLGGVAMAAAAVTAGAWPAGLALASVPVGLAGLRAVRMRTGRDRSGPPFVQALAVALVYDAARALALVIRTPHRGGGTGRRR